MSRAGFCVCDDACGSRAKACVRVWCRREWAVVCVAWTVGRGRCCDFSGGRSLRRRRIRFAPSASRVCRCKNRRTQAQPRTPTQLSSLHARACAIPSLRTRLPTRTTATARTAQRKTHPLSLSRQPHPTHAPLWPLALPAPPPPPHHHHHYNHQPHSPLLLTQPRRRPPPLLRRHGDGPGRRNPRCCCRLHPLLRASGRRRARGRA